MCEVNLVVDEAGEVATMSTELGIKELIALVPRNRVDKLCGRKKPSEVEDKESYFCNSRKGSVMPWYAAVCTSQPVDKVVDTQNKFKIGEDVSLPG